MYGVSDITPLSHDIWPCSGDMHGDPFNTAIFLPIVDRFNGVPL